jgi:hypothetical protein
MYFIFKFLISLADGKVFSWGYGGYGNIGDGATVSRAYPVRVYGIYTKTVVKLVAAAYGAFALTSGNFFLLHAYFVQIINCMDGERYL